MTIIPNTSAHQRIDIDNPRKWPPDFILNITRKADSKIQTLLCWGHMKLCKSKASLTQSTHQNCCALHRQRFIINIRYTQINMWPSLFFAFILLFGCSFGFVVMPSQERPRPPHRHQQNLVLRPVAASTRTQIDDESNVHELPAGEAQRIKRDSDLCQPSMVGGVMCCRWASGRSGCKMRMEAQ